MPFVFEAGTSGTMLNSNCESGHPCLVPDLRGEAPFLPIEYDPSCGLFMYGLYYVAVCSLLLHGGFVPWMGAVLRQVLSLHLWRGSQCSCPFTCSVMYHVVDLQMLKLPCSAGIIPTWPWWMILLMYCAILFASILLRNFAPMFIRDVGLYFSLLVGSLFGFGVTVMLAP